MSIFRRILLLFSCIIHFNIAIAQNTFNETVNQELYLSTRSIVNGTSWTNSVRYKGNRFCGGKEWKTGELIFSGKKYTNLQLNYDLLSDEIILFDDISNKGKYLQLNKNRIKSFTYWENGIRKSFENLQLFPDKRKEIYEVAYRGKVDYYIRHIKLISKQIDEVYMGRLYDKNIHYLKKDDVVYPIRKKKQLLNVLGNKASLKKYISKNNLRINSKNPENIVQLIQYYETLSQTN